MTTVEIFHDDELDDRDRDRSARQTAELLKLSAVQGLNATVGGTGPLDRIIREGS